MSGTTVKKTMGRALAALGIDTATATVTELGWTRVTLADGSRLSWNRLPQEDDAEVNWEWMRTAAAGWFLAEGGGEDFGDMLGDLVAHLRAA